MINNYIEESTQQLVLQDLIVRIGIKTKRSFGGYDEYSLKSLIKFMLIQKEYKEQYLQLWRSQDLTNLVILGEMLLNDDSKDI